MAKSKKKSGKKPSKKSSKKSGKLTKAERSQAAKKAARTRKANEQKRSASAKKAARSRKSGKSAASKKPRKSGSKKAKSRKSPKKGSKKNKTTKIVTNTKIIRVPVVKVVRVGAKKPKKKAKKKGSKKSRARETYAMENPLGGTELFVGGITALVGYGVSDLVDRFLATHALTDKNTKDASGNEQFADSPPMDGAYKGLYNSGAILAPAWSSPKRWIVGGVVTAAPFAIAALFIKAPVGRSALQFFGFGYGVRFFGKMVIDLVAMATRKTNIGQRLYTAEMSAIALNKAGGDANDPSFQSLTRVGLGHTSNDEGGPGGYEDGATKDGCGSCSCGGGGCASCKQGKSSMTPPPPPTSSAAPPSMIPTPPALRNPPTADQVQKGVGSVVQFPSIHQFGAGDSRQSGSRR